MQRAGAASRRFYSAFYQWSVRPRKPCARLHDQNVRFASVKIKGERHGARNFGAQRELFKFAEIELPKHQFKQLTDDQPVLPVEESPTGSLDIWTNALRSRSGDEVRVEICVPGPFRRVAPMVRPYNYAKVIYPPSKITDPKYPVVLVGKIGKVRKALEVIYQNALETCERARAADHSREGRNSHEWIINRYEIPKALIGRPSGFTPRALRRLQERTGLKSIRLRPMAGGREFLQLVGFKVAIDAATGALAQFIKEICSSRHIRRWDLEELKMDNDAYQPEPPSRVVVAAAPGGADVPTSLPDPDAAIREIQLETDCRLTVNPEKRLGFRVQGSDESVDWAIELLQEKIKRAFNVDLDKQHEYNLVIEGDHRVKPSKQAGKSAQQSIEQEMEEDIGELSAQDVERSAERPIEQEFEENVEEFAGLDTKQTPDQSYKDAQQSAKEDKTAEKSTGNPELSASANEFRTSLRFLSQPVIVLTAKERRRKFKQLDEERIHGVTISSFTTITLTPRPVVSFNLRLPSRTWDAIESTRELRMHMLHSSRAGATVAHAFTLPYENSYEPFGHLAQLGANPQAMLKFTTPYIKWKQAVFATFTAKPLMDKCVAVGDHMLIVAEIDDGSFEMDDPARGSGALAYGMRSYKRIGGDLHIVPGAEELFASGGAQYKKGFMRLLQDNQGKKKPADWEGGGNVQTRMAKMQEKEEDGPGIARGLTSKQPIFDPNNAFAEEAEPQTIGSGHKTAKGDLAAEAPRGRKAYPSTDTPDDDFMAKLNEEPDPHGTTFRPLDNAPASRASHPQHEGDSKSPGRSSYTLRFGRGGSSAPSSSSRHYSTSTSPPPDPSLPSNLRSISVKDYLAPQPRHPFGYRSLLATKRRADDLQAILDAAPAAAEDGPSALEDRPALEAEQAAARRLVARKLAVRNAVDLRGMLDEGRVVAHRVQWLEQNLEEGLAALIEDAKVLRGELEAGRVARERFEEGKKEVVRDHELLSTQLMRLRDLVEDDGGFGVGGE
ncbi:hypothetical protein WHR41_07903 [Cladosporium halotolerans]|uniref:Flavin reductase like domain-containing protein n=1 Tax=Cladosporium halotolerans TaxID=1052096 RepID=A0AB34KIZ9_9PEZI